MIDQKILYLDIETTGLDETVCGIYQISGIFEINNEVVEKFNFYINPGDVVVDDWVTGQLESNDMELEALLTFEDSSKIFDQVILLIDKHCNKFDPFDKMHVCGYNVQFDVKFIRQWFLNNDHKYYGSYFYPDNLCVYHLASFVLISIRYQFRDFKLSTLCDIFNIPIKAHDSYSDIEATRNLYKGLQNYFNVKVE